MDSLKIKQVVIWGHKLHSHTHSYIHYGFYKGFKHLGYKTIWLDDDPINNNSYDYSDALFITEGQVDSNIPILNNCYYLLHNCDLDKYKNTNKNIKILLLQVYTNDCLKIPLIKMIDRYIYYNVYSEFPILYMPWATDLLPEEIDKNIINIEENVLNKNSNIVSFVGMVTGEWLKVRLFCIFNNLRFDSVGGFSGVNVEPEMNQSLMQDSFMAPAIQTEWQVSKGYIPCRIFKNISYGKMGITNNQTVAELFNGNIIYNSNILKSLEMGIAFEKENKEYKKAKILYLMEYIKIKHTYLNRIKVILNCFTDKC